MGLNLTQPNDFFSDTLSFDYIEQLQQLDVTNVEPTAHPVPLTNVTRPDEVRKSLTNDEALMNAPAKGNGLFMVPKIVE